MTDAKIDDYSGKTYDPENEQTYTIEVKTKRPFKEKDAQTGEVFEGERTERLFFEVTHDSFMTVIGKAFEGKKILQRWAHWEDASPERKARYPNARGKWVKNKV